MERTYKGSCHCGTVRFEADIDLKAGTFKCNCEICTKTRMWGAIVKPDAFRLLAGEKAMVEYRPDKIHHLFCKHCGVQPFAWGEDPALGGKFYAVRVNCLDNVETEELLEAPVTYHDGASDRYGVAPAETKHL